jgi:hypothetical protein
MREEPKRISDKPQVIMIGVFLMQKVEVKKQCEVFYTSTKSNCRSWRSALMSFIFTTSPSW